MTEELMAKIEAATAKALENPGSVFVDPPGPRDPDSCMSCGESRDLDEHTQMCRECYDIACEFYPDGAGGLA